MLLDVTPLRNRDFSLVFAGQLVSSFGSFLTYVALPVQLWDLTRSSTLVGLVGTVQLVPLAVTSLWGGAFADSLDRRKLLLWSEGLLMVGSLVLVFNARLAQPSVAALFVVAAFMSGVNGFHRPALESMKPRLVKPEELPAMAALSALGSTVAAIAGPALAGILVSVFGVSFTFGVDAGTYVFSLAALWLIRAMPPAEEAERAGLKTIVEGLVYAARRPELIGTYVVDIVAMTFAMPMAVFPALAAEWHGSNAAGYLYSAMSAGALLVTLFSRWTARVKRRGAMVILAATVWGLAIVALGSAPSLAGAIACLVIAGGADMVSGLFRQMIWNDTIPSSLRGRMAGIEQLSYMSGPLLGNARAGFMAERLGLGRSIAVGGALCVAGVLACIPILPRFWRHLSTDKDGANPETVAK
ncbi:MAG: MFS transporter [Labilithrix sp.]